MAPTWAVPGLLLFEPQVGRRQFVSSSHQIVSSPMVLRVSIVKWIFSNFAFKKFISWFSAATVFITKCG